MRGPILAAACMLMSGCAGPSVAEQSTSGTVSELRTALAVTDAQLRGDTWWQYVEVVVADAEEEAASLEEQHQTQQLSDAVDLLIDLRRAVQRRDEDEIRRLLPALEKAAADLEPPR